MNLIWINKWIEYTLCSMYWICNEDNVIDVGELSSLIDSTPDSEKFSLSGSDIYCIIKYLDNWFFKGVDMNNRSGYLILDVYICYNNHCFRFKQHLKSDIIKFIIMHIFAFLLFLFTKWKEKWLWKISTSLLPRESSVLSILKKEKTLLSLLLASTIEPLTFNCCLNISLSSDRWWLLLLSECLDSSINLII